MILEIRNWCESIIVAVIICIIIESFIPNGNNKKYIKLMIGIYIMYITLNPILNILNYEFDFSKLMAELDNYEEVSYSLDNNIKNVYILGLQEDIKKGIEELGYEISEVKVVVDVNYENIEKIELVNINKKNNIENEIDNYDEIKQYLKQNYDIEINKIEFK